MADNNTAAATTMMQSSQLEQYLLLAKTAKGAAAAELIKQVTEAPGVHVFGELLDMPNIQELANGPHSTYLNLLNLFAFGTYATYHENKSQFPPLTPAMVTKLRHLTIVSLATKTKCIPYSTLLKELDMKNLRELEDMIIDVIYADVVRGKLDQKNNQLEVDYTIGRDIRPEDVNTIIRVLQECFPGWRKRIGDALRTEIACEETASGESESELGAGVTETLKCIPYSTLLKELDMKNLRELEDMIIDVIYADVVRGKLDQKNNQLEVDYTIGRDIRPEDVNTIIRVLQEWCTSCETVVNSIECQITRANAMKDSHIKLKQHIENEVASVKKNLKVQSQDVDDQMGADGRDDSHMDKPGKKGSKSKGCVS
ncbi:hypothetical protein HPB51_021303 [Rhipicephalus microplus]|uniref:PCI domain-containing protein n=1 Tax=Rhipicephalus microplus TaxID=6941 RepID=A0A9J6F697_RHIMP|nr:hypothetical protein HPB51_021303 [Rhipicephalus microplus]